MLDEIVWPFGVKKEGKINKKKGENELKLLKINK